MWVRLLGAVAVLCTTATGCASIHTADHAAGSAPVASGAHSSVRRTLLDLSASAASAAGPAAVR